MKNYQILCLALPVLLSSCTPGSKPEPQPVQYTADFSPAGLAKMFSSLPLDKGHLKEVYNAVGKSSGNGYDEEYTMGCLIDSPGAGVGDSPSSKAESAQSYSNPLRDLLRDYLESHPATKGGDVDDMLKQLSQSDFQLYWPYSDNWDGESFPIITFDPGSGAETNYGYRISPGPDGLHVVDSVFVDEALATKQPVWVFNSNSDASFTPLKLEQAAGSRDYVPLARHRRLLLKNFKMKRNYDSWFGGASEFWVKCGSVEGFNATTDAELKLFYPSVTDFMIVVKRRLVNQDLPFEAILVGDFTSQLDKIVFMITEDDGGTLTNWKADAVVKIQSKTYGFSIDLPYNEKDDIVWRGQLSARFFEEADIVRGRFGDVEASFELD
ncbi:MAG: hypothetical protein J6O51_05820 [Bacteroidales bacterium]|nr:hypothetical protein [Bacteroidales bacterium]